ncbi:MAG: pirin family protein [Alphaproteobacteria bacterium]
MSWNPSLEPSCPVAGTEDSIETLIVPRARDLGSFEVRRALPAPKRQMVGPFIFFDQAGPADFITGQGVDVRPHPHIGLGTVTYLYKGEFQHRDSLGSNQMIYPGAVNWMVAGHGVTHSERTSEATRKAPHSLFGIQTWVALPDAAEDSAPSFEHHPKDNLPSLDNEGVHMRLILGRAYGETAPVTMFSDMFYADVIMQQGAALPMPEDHEDRGLYVSEGAVEIAGQGFEAGRMMVFRPGDAITVKAGGQGARVMILGGETLNGPRHIWWNFVASSEERIEQAKADWRAGRWQDGRFALPPDDRDEFIPLPDGEQNQRPRSG